uniref:Uncharacterized protein n=1 Tax=Anguilla anguilla TaxID=7936 RepID=A0A0E9VF12_ANGAN
MRDSCQYPFKATCRYHAIVMLRGVSFT